MTPTDTPRAAPLPLTKASRLIAQGWAARVRSVSRQIPARSMIVPLDPDRYARGTTVRSLEQANRAVEFVRQRDVPIVGLGVAGDINKMYTPNVLNTIVLAMVLAEPVGHDLVVHPFVFEPLNVEAMPAVRELLGLPATYAVHDLSTVLLALWSLGLTAPSRVWDTKVTEAAFSLGLHHPRYDQLAETPELVRRRRAEERRDAALVPEVVALTYGIELPPVYGNPSPVDRAVSLATLSALAYPKQAAEAARLGCLHHLMQTEMPWVVTTARMTLNGVRLDLASCSKVAAAAERHAAELAARLAEFGISNPTDDGFLKTYFESVGLLALFRTHDGYGFDGDRLDAAADRHPAIPLIRAARRVRGLTAGRLLSGEFVKSDGRVHPTYRVLGAHSGRLTCDSPNITGVGKIFRPLVVPEPGYSIGECDFAQIEAGIAGAVYGDANLVSMFNSGDVYSAMAQLCHADELPAADRDLSPNKFKAKYPHLRTQLKICTLGVIYGLGPHGLALRLGVSQPRASDFMKKFFGMFPSLRDALEDGPKHAEIRGCVPDISGLRRRRPGKGSLTTWERNWCRNHPVQGAAATIFKIAWNELDRLYPKYGAKLVVPLHDAFVFEAPQACVKAVAELTANVMIEAVREQFPGLHPRVTVNVSNPSCWNRDGCAGSVELWIEDPLFSL